MKYCKTPQKQRVFFVFIMVCFCLFMLIGRLVYLMIYRADYYGKKAKAVQQRERSIKGSRGRILDRNGVVLAGNKSVSTISVIHNQIKQPERVIKNLSRLLDIEEEEIRKKVNKVSSREKIKSNVEKTVSDKIRNLEMDGVMIDEDYKRTYPFNSLASKVIGFTGADNQGILGLEVKYEKYLKGEAGYILTTTNARGIEVDKRAEERIEPRPGKDLYTSIDINIQKFATQAAKNVMEAKEAKNVRILVMDPNDGEIFAMVNVPEFNLNKPYEIKGNKNLNQKELNEKLNDMWRNGCVCDTYEPGSTFKVFTATAAYEQGVVKLTDTFNCPGYKIVGDRRIRCHKTTGHGTETFAQGVQNSCNPVFMEVGQRLGVSNMFKYLKKFSILDRTGIDVPGEAVTIMHKQEKVGEVELATMSFGQSFQLSPIRLITTISAVINGGKMVTPHFGVNVVDQYKHKKYTIKYKTEEKVISKDTSEVMKKILESVVTEGGGKKAAVEGYKVGAKTGTSEKLPRRSGKYIASCMGFAPADNPKVIALVLIDEPTGVYYGGTIAAPVISKLLDDVLPYVDGK
ncbi:peptidoglycan glycosyltransferase [Eubacterium sp. MSJ-13]|uniref:peptidoglycan D,D-transpeptidase FtsI family protein n=1 Tax=Eubacterium sp. MSJ-13 TaxID=2841513 RepID=UPI001C1118CB|nr:penicillin-binding transpeptidase domain-containing protein [Eubacterium sp. MSJ-13]MBU5478947.1 peptidoglycan glycosyltransferase [Eubacterium sp. MSJ-13]